MNSAVFVQLALTLGGLLTAFMAGLFNRRTRHVTAEVTLSVEAREWARAFEDRAVQAEKRAARAEERAEEIERAATLAADRVNNCEHRMRVLERHVERLQGRLLAAGIDPPPNPLRTEFET